VQTIHGAILQFQKTIVPLTRKKKTSHTHWAGRQVKIALLPTIEMVQNVQKGP